MHVAVLAKPERDFSHADASRQAQPPTPAAPHIPWPAHLIGKRNPDDDYLAFLNQIDREVLGHYNNVAPAVSTVRAWLYTANPKWQDGFLRRMNYFTCSFRKLRPGVGEEWQRLADILIVPPQDAVPNINELVDFLATDGKLMLGQTQSQKWRDFYATSGEQPFAYASYVPVSRGISYSIIKRTAI